MIRKFIILVLISYVTLNAIYIKEENNGQTVVLDTATNLIWQDFEVNELSWKDALKYCENLEVGIYKDWTLPTYVELYSIVDLSKTEPALSDIFTEKTSTGYWTSTIYEPNRVWAINFKTGSNTENYHLEVELRTRCVHIK